MTREPPTSTLLVQDEEWQGKVHRTGEAPARGRNRFAAEFPSLIG
jgi:hypothetical protein